MFSDRKVFNWQKFAPSNLITLFIRLRNCPGICDLQCTLEWCQHQNELFQVHIDQKASFIIKSRDDFYFRLMKILLQRMRINQKIFVDNESWWQNPEIDVKSSICSTFKSLNWIRKHWSEKTSPQLNISRASTNDRERVQLIWWARCKFEERWWH